MASQSSRRIVTVRVLTLLPHGNISLSKILQTSAAGPVDDTESTRLRATTHIENRIRIHTWIMGLNRRRCILQLSQTPSRPRKLIEVNPLCIQRVTLLEFDLFRRGDPIVKSLCHAAIPKFVHDRVVNPAHSRMETANGLKRRMGVAVGMCILL